MAQPQPSSHRIREFNPAGAEATAALWEACGLTRPWNDPHADIARKLSTQPELFVVADEAGTIIDSVMAGYDRAPWMDVLPGHFAATPKIRNCSSSRSAG